MARGILEEALKVFTVATFETTYSPSGKFEREDKIQRVGPNRAGPFPPLFRTWEAASKYLSALNVSHSSVVVELAVVD